MSERPGSSLARRPLHFFVLADCSGSMAANGKIQALNTALREAIPHLAEAAAHNPHAEVMARVVAFGTSAYWHVKEPTLAEELEWVDLVPGGYTALGAALRLVTDELRTPPMEARALPPAMVLISDGLPTDDYKQALEALLNEPWGRRAVRLAVGIGRDADQDVLQQFIADDELEPLSASSPEQLIRMIRWASTHASRVASSPVPSRRFGPVAQSIGRDAANELTW